MPDLDFKVESAAAIPHAAAPTLVFKLRVTQEAEAGPAGKVQSRVPDAGRARLLPSRSSPENSGSADLGERPSGLSLRVEDSRTGASPSPDQPDGNDTRAPTPIHSVALRCQIRLEPGRRRYSPDEQAKLGELFGEPHRWGQTVRSMLWAHTSIVIPPFAGETIVDLPVPCTFDFNVAQTKYFDALTDGQVPLCFLFSGTIFYAGEEDGALQVGQISWEKEADFRLPVQVWRQMMDIYYPNTAWLCLRKDAFDRLQGYKRGRAMPSWEKAIESLLDQAEERVTP